MNNRVSKRELYSSSSDENIPIESLVNPNIQYYVGIVMQVLIFHLFGMQARQPSVRGFSCAWYIMKTALGHALFI